MIFAQKIKIIRSFPRSFRKNQHFLLASTLNACRKDTEYIPGAFQQFKSISNPDNPESGECQVKKDLPLAPKIGDLTKYGK